MTVTDFDVDMVDAASTRLAGVDRVTVQHADATALPFEDASFDAVVSWIMLHHTVAWEKTLAESLRVVRPGGFVVGYDLLSTAPFRLLHRAQGIRVRAIHMRELRVMRDLPVDQAILTPSLGGLVVRFLLRKQSIAV